jgi:hypothetical protein
MDANVTTDVADNPPNGIEFSGSGGETRLRARAGKVTWPLMAAFLISAVWTVKWALDLAAFVRAFSQGPAENPGPAMFIHGFMVLAGFYCAALCLWTMVGHETLVLRGGRLSLGNPWLFGLRTRSYDAGKVEPFECRGQDCGVQAEGDTCCCRWSAVDYALTFGYNGRRVSVFPHLARESKDWLRERLNARLGLASSAPT